MILKALFQRRFVDAVGTLWITICLCCEVSRTTTVNTKWLFIHGVIEFL